jgi:hypothetical protein
MKISDFAVMAAFVMLLPACGGKKSRVEPPQIIQSNFETRFGRNDDVIWKASGQDEFQASFTRDGHPTNASFDGQGNWLRTETELLPSEVPSVIISTVTGAFHGSGITKAIQIEASGKDMIYRLILKKGRQLSTVDLNTQGVIQINTL